MKTKFKAIACAQAALACVLGVSGMAGNIYASENVLKPVKDKTYELGDKVYLEADEFLKNKDQNVLLKTAVSSDLMTNDDMYDFNEETREVVSEDEDRLDVGTYSVQLKYEDEIENVKFKVKDTKAPIIKNLQKEINIEVNSEIKPDEFKHFFDVEDFSDYDLDIDLSNVDINHVGTYPMLVTATDIYGNRTRVTVDVNVVSTEEAEETGNLTAFVSGEIPVSSETRQRMEAGETNIHENIQKEDEESDDTEKNSDDNGNSSSDEPVTPETPTTPETPGTPTEPTNPETPVTPAVTTRTSIVKTRMSELEDQLWTTINTVRTSDGLSSLTKNDELSTVADTAASQSASQNSVATESSGTTDSGTSYVSKTSKTDTMDTYSSVEDINNQFGSLVTSGDAVQGNVAVYQSQVTTETLTNGVVTDSNVTETNYYATVVVDQPVATEDTSI